MVGYHIEVAKALVDIGLEMETIKTFVFSCGAFWLPLPVFSSFGRWVCHKTVSP
jgi:hypothetical protein